MKSLHIGMLRQIRRVAKSLAESASEGFILQDQGAMRVILRRLLTGLIHFCHWDDELLALQEEAVNLGC